MILSNKRITNVLIRLHRCGGWSEPLLFANPRRQVFLHQGQLVLKNSLLHKKNVFTWAITGHSTMFYVFLNKIMSFRKDRKCRVCSKEVNIWFQHSMGLAINIFRANTALSDFLNAINLLRKTKTMGNVM